MMMSVDAAFSLLQFNDEILMTIQMHLRPCYAAPLMQTCHRLRGVCDRNQEYWTRVAAHLVWREMVPAVKFSRAEHFLYGECYFRDMNAALVHIQRHIEDIVENRFEQLEFWAMDREESIMPYYASMAPVWRAHLHDPWEAKVRVQLERFLKDDGLQKHMFGYMTSTPIMIPTFETEPMKRVAELITLHHVQQWPKREANSQIRDDARGKKLRDWARRFAALPGLSDHEKGELMTGLLTCTMDGSPERLGYDLINMLSMIASPNDPQNLL